MPEPPPPIFVVGHARSGTTLMRLMLSAHPHIYIQHESSFYLWESMFPEDRTGSDFLHYYFRTFSFLWLKIDPKAVLAELPDPLPRTEVHQALAVMMRLKAQSYGKVRFGDKSPPHTGFLGRIFVDFPGARVIQTTRDPRAEVASISRTPWGADSVTANCLNYEYVRRKMEPYAGRIHRVKLEDLLKDPEPVLRETLEFVGEPWDDAVLDHSAHRADAADMPDVPWLARAGRAIESEVKNRPSEAQYCLTERLCRKALVEYGYPQSDCRRAKASATSLGLREAPATLRTTNAWRELQAFLKDPENWGPIHGGGTLEGVALLKKINPTFWKQNSGFEFPTAPGGTADR